MKLTIKRILCPTDFSKHSAHALDYATAFCATYQAELILLHVLEPLPVTLPADTLGTDALLQMERVREENAAKEIEKIAQTLRDELNSVATRLTRGSPSLGIIEAARSLDVDLIVLGTHGRSGLSHILLGSVAEKVVRKAPCPVLTVKHPEHEFVMP